ncbi:methylated-DNA--[protein]-cysteine S-methyltransferase [Ornithinimicrobium sp. Arc0846-15]|nr:methylated-DNA--[protein]-cysteine S-methyltransferase [Ornithinimicrobium laminariae]
MSDEATLAALNYRLRATAEQEGLLDVAYRTIDTPIGQMLLAATDAGLVRVAFATEGLDEVLQQLADQVSPRVLLAPRRLDTAASQLDHYFAGDQATFDIPLDWQLSAGFRREALRQLQQIGYGTTQSYAQVAAATSSPRAVRAVGTACATNPLPIVVPCHRVTKSDGTRGNYRGGIAAKDFLLDLESPAAP